MYRRPVHVTHEAMIVEREILSTMLASAKMSPTTIPANAEKQKRSNGESIPAAGTACAGSDSAPAKQQNAFASSSGHNSHVECEQPHPSSPAAALPKAHIPPPSTTTAQAATQKQQQPSSSSSVAPNASSAHIHTYSGITNSEIYDQSQVYAHHAAAAQSVCGGGSSSAAAALGGVQYMYVQAPPYPSSSSSYYHHPTSIGGDNNHHQTTPSFHHGYPPQRQPTATTFVTTTAGAAPDAIHRRHHPNPTYPPPPHQQVSVPGPGPAPATTNLDLAGSAQDEMAEFAAQSAKLRQIERLEQEVVKRRRMLEASLTARYGGGARGRNSPPTSSPPAAPSTYPPPSRLPASSSLYSSDGTSEGGHTAAGSGYSMYGQSFPSPLRHHPRSLSAQMPHRHEHQHHRPPHFSPNPSLGEPMAHSALPPPALAPVAGPGAGSGSAGSGMCPQASSRGSSAAGPAKSTQVLIPSTSMMCTSGVPHYTNRHVIPLGLGDEDRNHITEYLCFVRNEIIEIFPATARDVHSDGNARGVVQGQVGMRCRFCAHRNRMERANRSTSYPSSVPRMYQSLTMMMREHLPACPEMPPDVRERYNVLKAGNTGSRTKESKRYWIASAHSIGLVDTEDGIHMRPPTTAAPSVLAVQAPQP